MPPDFQPLIIPSTIAKIHTVLFGPKPRRLAMNYRLWQLMVILHITELEQFVLALDPRITYRPDADVSFEGVIDLPSLPDVVSEIECMLSPADYNLLFGHNAVEPYLTFRNLWEKHDQLAYKLGGLVLAVAYRMSEIGAS